MKRTNKSVRGFTVIELLIVIAIIVTATLVIVNRVGAARQSSQVQSESGNMQAIVATTQSAFAGRPDYTGLDNSVLFAMGGFPAMMTAGQAGATVKPLNAWQGNVDVTVVAGAPTITYSAVPSKACIELTNNIAPSFKTVSIGGQPVKDASNAAMQINDLATTQTLCTTATGVAVVAVTF